MALTDGAAHAVDSSELAFKLACQYAFRDAYARASPTVLEPIMAVEVRDEAGTVILHQSSRTCQPVLCLYQGKCAELGYSFATSPFASLNSTKDGS